MKSYKNNSIYLLAEKVFWTYVQSLVAVMTVGSAWHVAFTTQLAISALPAALTVLANGLPAVPGNLPFSIDLAFRTLRTGATTFIGCLVSQPIFHLTANMGRSALIAAGAAVLAVLKGAAASKIGALTAATLPASLDVVPTNVVATVPPNTGAGPSPTLGQP